MKERIVDEVFDQYRVDLTAIPMAMSRMREACENAKKALSVDRETIIQLPFLANDQHGAPINYERKISREWVEELTKDLLDRLEPPVTRALLDAGIAPGELEEVLLVGGMTRWPAVQELAERVFKRKPSKGVNPDEVVALGAAAYAGILAGESDEAQLLDVTPHDIGIRVGDSHFATVLPRNSMLPVRARRLFATTSENQKFVSIELYQGESQDVAKNRKLGQVVLDDLPPGPAGSVRVELAITVDVEGIVTVSAREIKTGREASVVIRPSGGLSQREIVEIINRRRQEHSAAAKLPKFEGGAMRVTTREYQVARPEDPDEEK
jgi:molecular chaperone DnaK